MNDIALTTQEIKDDVQKIQHVMKAVMKKDIHYGIIPGCSKPTLYKAGSEKILATFKLAVEPIVEDLSTSDEVKHRITTRITHMQTGTFVGSGIGECSSSEEKYKWRKAVCEQEFEETSESRRREKWVVKYANGKKVWKDGAYVYTQVKQVRTNIADVANTILKMAKKRSQIDGTLTSTAASDIFDQDLEDLPVEMQEDIAERQTKPQSSKPEVEMPKAKSEVENQSEEAITDKPPSQSLECSDCGAVISEKVKNYSMDKYNKALCFNCQKKVKQ